jgi:hypothetical protein
MNDINKGSPVSARIDLLFQDDNVPMVESIRQWLVIALCSIVIGLCLHAVYRVYRTQRQFT